MWVSYMHIVLTLQYEATAGFEAIRGVISLSSCGSACQCQKDSRLADKFKRGVAGQKQAMMLDKGCSATEPFPSTPALQLKTAAPRYDEEIVWSLCRLQ